MHWSLAQCSESVQKICNGDCLPVLAQNYIIMASAYHGSWMISLFIFVAARCWTLTRPHGCNMHIPFTTASIWCFTTHATDNVVFYVAIETCQGYVMFGSSSFFGSGL